MRLIFAAVSLSVLSACIEAPVLIGDGCSAGNHCGENPRAACIVAWPSGYCTEIDCGVGSCPPGSSCVTGLAFPEVEFDAFCLASCDDIEDCREGYRCVEASPGEKVCAPLDP